MRFYNPIAKKLLIYTQKPPLTRMTDEGWYTVPSKWKLVEIARYFRK